VRDFDVVVYGATGFTGALTAEYLAKNAPRDLKWAIGGRSQRKLDEVRKKLEREPCPPSGVIIADVADDASMRAMTGKTRVLVTTVGPFDEHGEPVVRACVEEGTDYLDITGEPHFVDGTIERYHERAKERGIKVVSCCGFDSIPHDLGVLYTLDVLGAKDEPITIEGFVSSKGTFSGGTWHSAIRAMSKFGEHRRERKNARRPPSNGARKVRGVKPRVRYEKEIRGWACPLPTIDPQIVLRSARMMDEYGPDFRYGHYARVKRLPTLVAGAAAIGSVFALAQLPPTRELLLKVRDPGQGPSEEARAKAWFRVTFVAKAAGRTVVTEVAGGDPGYGETSKMLAESALTLALDRDKTSAHAGVITPAAAMGRPLLDRLVRAGITFRHVRG
jgi:short subunit dehydrogenase-like uncharacterized protein